MQKGVAMELKWQNGIYKGATENGIPHGKGILVLENGIKKGTFEHGELISGCEYIDGTMYVGTYKSGLYHGNGYLIKDYGYTWRGIFENGEKVECDDSDRLPNSVFIPIYYGNLEPKFTCESNFPGNGTVGERGYCRRTGADLYKLPLLSKVANENIVCAVESCNNHWNYSKGYNENAMFFTGGNGGSMYTDALVCAWYNGDYQPLEPKTAEMLADYINETLLENLPKYDEVQLAIRAGGYVITDEGIYRGELDENGVPNGNGRMVYDYDDPERRAYCRGDFENGKLNSNWAYIYYRPDAPNGDEYVGGLKDGVFSGKGYLTTKHGKMSDMWENGLLHGDDCYIDDGGKTWRGKYEHGQLVQGYTVDGDYRYDGEFKNMLPHGRGRECGWGGWFEDGQRIVGEGGENENALLISAMGSANPISFYRFDTHCFELMLSADKVEFIKNEKTAELGKKLGCGLCIAVSLDSGEAKNSLAGSLFGVDAGGACIAVGHDGKSFKGLSKDILAKLKELIKESAEQANKTAANTFRRTLLDRSFKSHWVITAETHDDYPTEGYEVNNYTQYYLIEIGSESYFMNLSRTEDEMYDAFDKAANEELEASASARLHKLPEGMRELEEIRAYTDKKNDWSKSVEIETIYTTKSKFGDKEREKIFAELINKLFKKELKEKK